jgi:hypothetical protein
METKHPEFPWVDPNFDENRRNFPEEERSKYAGQHVAWSWDGTAILAGDPDGDVLIEKLRAAGIDTSRVVFDYVDTGDMSYL